MKGTHRLVNVLAAVMIVLAVAGVAAAQSGTVYYACVLRDGTMYLQTGPGLCGRNQTEISWNQTGPIGPQGPQGEPGPAGSQGPQGEPGPAGSASLAGLQGTECTVGAGAGTVQLATDVATGLVTVRCAPTLRLALAETVQVPYRGLFNRTSGEVLSITPTDPTLAWCQDGGNCGCALGSDQRACSFVVTPNSAVGMLMFEFPQQRQFHVTCPDGTVVQSTFDGFMWSRAICPAFSMDGDKSVMVEE